MLAESEYPLHQPLEQHHRLIQQRRHHRQQYDACHHQIHLENLPAVDDEIPQPRPGHQEFPGDDPHQRQSDVDLEGVKEGGYVIRQHDFAENLPFGGTEGARHTQGARVGIPEAAEHLQHRHHQRNSQRHKDNGAGSGSCQNYDNRTQRDFRQAVEHHQIRLADPGNQRAPPQEDRQQHPGGGAQQKARQGFTDGDPQMVEQVAPRQRPIGAQNSGGLAEDEAVDPAQPRRSLP